MPPAPVTKTLDRGFLPPTHPHLSPILRSRVSAGITTLPHARVPAWRGAWRGQITLGLDAAEESRSPPHPAAHANADARPPPTAYHSDSDSGDAAEGSAPQDASSAAPARAADTTAALPPSAAAGTCLPAPERGGRAWGPRAHVCRAHVCRAPVPGALVLTRASGRVPCAVCRVALRR